MGVRRCGTASEGQKGVPCSSLGYTVLKNNRSIFQAPISRKSTIECGCNTVPQCNARALHKSTVSRSCYQIEAVNDCKVVWYVDRSVCCTCVNNDARACRTSMFASCCGLVSDISCRVGDKIGVYIQTVSIRPSPSLKDNSTISLC